MVKLKNRHVLFTFLLTFQLDLINCKRSNLQSHSALIVNSNLSTSTTQHHAGWMAVLYFYVEPSQQYSTVYNLSNMMSKNFL